MKPIPGLERVHATDEFLVFEVQSFSDPKKTYRVDKSLWYGSGSCSCEQFCCRIQPELGKGNWNGQTTCKHIDLIDRFVSCNGARLAIEQRQKLTNKPYNQSEPNL